MDSAKLFFNGQSQAVRLPKEYRFTGNEVYVKKIGNTVMLFPKDQIWETFLNGLNSFTEDFYVREREQDFETTRETL